MLLNVSALPSTQLLAHIMTATFTSHDDVTQLDISLAVQNLSQCHVDNSCNVVWACDPGHVVLGMWTAVEVSMHTGLQTVASHLCHH